MKLGEILAFARGLKRWSLNTLEKRSGVSNALISQIETGWVKSPGFITVAKLCAALDLDVRQLLRADDVLGAPAPTDSKPRKRNGNGESGKAR